MNATDEHYVRWMRRPDLPRVLEIEDLSYAAGRWGRGDFLTALRRHDCIAAVAEAGGLVVGFLLYRLGKVAANVLNLAVHPAYRRSGVATGLLRHMGGKITPRRAASAFVRDCNLPTQLLLRRCGYAAEMYVPDYFPDPPGDAIYFRKEVRR